MNYVALRMLFGDRAKYLMLLCGLTFAVMLIVQQGSIFWGLMIWSQSSISNLNVPIWVTDPGKSNRLPTPRSIASVASPVWNGPFPCIRGSYGPGLRTASITKSP